jgi:hypothetical protein
VGCGIWCDGGSFWSALSRGVKVDRVVFVADAGSAFGLLDDWQPMNISEQTPTAPIMPLFHHVFPCNLSIIIRPPSTVVAVSFGH